MRALWLIPPDAVPYASGGAPEQGLGLCHLASVRLRTAVAALEWKRSGNENIFRDPAALSAPGGLVPEAAEICIVPKYYHDLPLQPWLDACRAARRSGSRLVVDISDNPFRKLPPVPAFYSEVLKICDAVVVNSERMAELTGPHTEHRPRAIEDAILGPMGKPSFAPGGRLELLWFGHPTNLPYLHGCLDALIAFGEKRRCRLSILTMERRGAEGLAQEINARFAPAFEARFIRWSLESMKSELRKCDLVLLPSDPADPFKAGASANRIAEALGAGRLPIASPLPSYLQFADAAWIGPDLVEGIRWALGNRGEALARIRRGQAIVADKFAASKVGRQWGELFESLVSAPRSGS